jgi:hypothetical protein
MESATAVDNGLSESKGAASDYVEPATPGVMLRAENRSAMEACSEQKGAAASEDSAPLGEEAYKLGANSASAGLESAESAPEVRRSEVTGSDEPIEKHQTVLELRGPDNQGFEELKSQLADKSGVSKTESAKAALTNDSDRRVSAQTNPEGLEASSSGRPSTPANNRYSQSRPASPSVPSLRGLESGRPSSAQSCRPTSPLDPSRAPPEKGPISPRTNSPFLQKNHSFGHSNVSAKRITSMLVEKKVHSGLRGEYEDDLVSPRAFEVKPLADTDGLCAVLYHYLWRKTNKGKGCPGVNLPDTIVYRYRQPTHWFFTSVHDGQVRTSEVPTQPVFFVRVAESFSLVSQGVRLALSFLARKFILISK